jgi:hypothetical protein
MPELQGEELKTYPKEKRKLQSASYMGCIDSTKKTKKRITYGMAGRHESYKISGKYELNWFH